MLVDTPRDPYSVPYHIGAWIDAKEKVEEVNENNNTFTKDISYIEFDELTSFSCEHEPNGLVTCNWSEDFYESFTLWDSNNHTYLYEGNAHSYSEALPPGEYSLYVNGYDYFSNSYCPFRGPINITIEEPLQPEAKLFNSTGSNYGFDSQMSISESAPEKLLVSTTNSSGTVTVYAWINEENHVVVHSNFKSTGGDIENTSTLRIEGHTVKDVILLENNFEQNYLVFFCLYRGNSRILLYEITENPQTSVTEIWHKSVYSFNFDRVTNYFIKDFDGNGESELACWYRYPGTNNRTKFFVWDGFSTGNLNDPVVFNESYKINMDNVVDMISGDFNGDGFSDIACFYDYNPGVPSKQAILVWKSDGKKLEPFETWLTVGTYTFNFLGINSIETADVNGDFMDDIVVLYEYTDRKRIFTAKSTSESFDRLTPWIRTLPKNDANLVSPAYLNHDMMEDLIIWPFHN